MLRELSWRINDTVQALSQRWPSDRKSLMRLNPHESELAIPPAEYRRRIAGSEISSDLYRITGELDAQVVVNIAEVYGVDSEAVVLDWGVGCGRILRHLPEPWLRQSCGMDVDRINLDWCRSAFRQYGSEFWQLFHDADAAPVSEHFGKYDLIYSFSVFTHLSEHDQIGWLKALSAMCRGVMILSVHGLAHSMRASWMEHGLDCIEYLQSGMRDAGESNHDIDGQVPDGYYRDIAHTPEYIRRVWGQFVDVIDVIPGCFSQQHDAVVCRSKIWQKP